MATLILDFDSTLVTCESLDEILARGLRGKPAVAARIRAITSAGMEGRIAFADSLRQRLALATPKLSDVIAFGEEVTRLVTPGMDGLVKRFHDQGDEVWIVSSAPREAMLAVGAKLAIPEERILGASLLWNDDGSFAGIDDGDPFCVSKAEGVRGQADDWSPPRIGVGDGMSDYALYEERLVDHFIAFTKNARRPPLVETAVPEARDVARLSQLIDELL